MMFLEEFRNYHSHSAEFPFITFFSGFISLSYNFHQQVILIRPLNIAPGIINRLFFSGVGVCVFWVELLQKQKNQ